jgi:DNA (cytosine-5)-methyltransferase 1
MKLSPEAHRTAADPGSEAKTFCEFFAGIGLVREGLQASGWQCVYANDNDPNKEMQYHARFGDDHFHLEDVRETGRVVSEIPGSPALATASFPCIDLSLAGHWRGFKGEHSSTFFSFADVIAGLGQRKPRLVMLENVGGFLTSNDGKDFAAVAQTLSSLGFALDAFVLDAKYFVPQSRVRVFVVGIDKSVLPKCHVTRSSGGALDPWLSAITRSPKLRPHRLVQLQKSIDLDTEWVAVPFTPPKERRQHLREFIDLDDSQEWWDAAQVKKHYEMMSDLHRAQVDELLRDKQSIHVGTIFRRKRYGKTRAEIRFDGMAGCLRVPRGGSARQIVIVIDKGELKIRWMSPREYARLQGAPTFPLVGKPNQQMWGFGDAVCVPAIHWIDKNVLTPLYEAIEA